ncbi:type II CRISPR-associated endonuclease Cas1 [Azospira inquinata]|uniref:Type II CRISPR-associated endonuclease Cas1 n=1 Tax=Azospira inquinata TaxID=2785627 RepID=A0A975XV12_9RHOO|nr:type II CRISPR-associated endonuclease Cas1 [Azospira inquinata]QWT45330.1 type II CRISPR-associated endonuclease Cas1 [Azospira inquinata]QWT49339.1 type II CRISPR-associated endonuclease Cas1 [Azospira inquinata]
MISRPAKLRREHFSLAIEQEQTAFVPFEDIAIIVLNHREILLTHPVLSACADYGIGLYATGDNHQPNGVFLPFLAHSRTTRLMRRQMDLPRPLAKQAWASIIRRKIENQAAVLRFCAKNGVDRMDSYARRVRSGDTGNLEGQAAAFYFTQLFGQGFYRAEEHWANAALDYGYAVLRGAIARGLVAHGMHPPIGLFHASEQNAFNLADDLIEPFRPLVDLYVAKNPTFIEDDLSPQHKAELVALLNVDVGMPQGKMSVLSAIEYTVESLARLFEEGNSELELPALIGLQAHRLEC